ncbi:MAG: RNA methyltransferase [Clostridia bacterium]|nr:RNA methyltransferase [Clostridia bacterium]
MRETVVSRQNPTVKRICGLNEKKNRRAEGLFRFDGIKLLKEALTANISVTYVVLRVPVHPEIESFLQEQIALGNLSEEALFPVSESVFDKMTEEHAPEGIITVAALPTMLHRGDSATGGSCLPCREEPLLVLESVRDPGNLGTVLRSAYALGLGRVVLTDDCADLYHPKTVRGAMGALFRLPTVTVPQEELPAYIRLLCAEGRRLYAAALHTKAETLGRFPLSPGDGFVIGNEGHGHSAEVLEACGRAALIPMREGAESLNAAAAAVLCIWETVRAADASGGKII